MKKIKSFKFIYLFYLLATTQILYSQESAYLNIYECSNHNAFLVGDSIESLKYFTDTIYPSGIMDMNISKSGEYDGWQNLLPLMNVDQGTTFRLIMASPNRFDPDKKYYRYQQYYQGVKVKGGGVTVSSFIPDGPGPCEVDFLMAPYIASSIDVSVSPTVSSSNLGTILSTSNQIDAELVISLNMKNDCQYHLVWEARYIDGDNKISWVDAHTGAVLKTVDGYDRLNAPTQVYGTQNLDDSFVSGSQLLVSADGRTRTYNSEAAFSCPNDTAEFNPSATPVTTDTVWTTEADSAVYQAHYVTTSIVPILDGIGIVFSSVNVAVCSASELSNNARSFVDNTPDGHFSSFVKYGRTEINNKSMAVFDVVAHELTHAFLNEYFRSSEGIGSGTLHESITDMVAVYVESVIQNGIVDWVMGDDVIEIDSITKRDFQNPQYDCFTDSSLSTNLYLRGDPLRYWFYMLSTGDGLGYPGLGLEAATKIVLEAVNLLGSDPDYVQLRLATKALVDEEYGPCSQESRMITEAWGKICVGGANTCEFSIVGQNEVCEEDDYLQLCISGAYPGVTYNWIYPYEWTVQSGTTGGGANGICLTVIDFPKYNWYPKYFQIKAIMIGTGFHKTRTVKLVDCLGDDPTCEEYNSSNDGGQSSLMSSGINSYSIGSLESEPRFLRVYDMNGTPIYSGESVLYKKSNLPNNCLFIFVYFDENLSFLKSEKVVYIR